jgi:uroporphyrinogen III methyltransferase/synthase
MSHSADASASPLPGREGGQGVRSERSLAGRRIAITRPLGQSAALAGRLEALGAHVVSLPAIAITPAADTAQLDAALAALAALATYDWIVFTSVNGVVAVAARLVALGLEWSARGRARLAAIGPATAAALAERGLPPDLVPREYVAEGLIKALGNVAGQHILLPRADIAREVLARELRLRGADVDEIAAYHTVAQPLAPDLLDGVFGAQRADAITFTSSSTVRSLIESLRAAGREPSEALAGIALAAIGPITAATLREHGLEPAVVAAEYTIAGLVDALVAYFTADLA